MAAGDIYRVWARVPLGDSQLNVVAFLKQQINTTSIGANIATAAFLTAFADQLEPLLSDQLGEGPVLTERLPPAGPETYAQTQLFSGSKSTPAVVPQSTLALQLFPRDDAKNPSQLLNIPGITTDQVLDGALTVAARADWELAGTNFMTELASGPFPSPFLLQIVPYGPLAYPLPDGTNALAVDRVSPVSYLRVQTLTNVRLRQT